MDNVKDSDNSEEYDDYFGFISENKKTKIERPSYGGYEEERNTVDNNTVNTTVNTAVNTVEKTQEDSSNLDNAIVDPPSDTFSIEVSHSESGDSSPDCFYREKPSILWNRREYYFDLDQSTRDKIWKVFERRIKTSQRQTVIDKDLNEDAFYSSYAVTPSYDISYLREDKYINRVLACESLRSLNMQFLGYNSLNTRDIERYIQLYRMCTDFECKPLYKSIILQKKRIEFLINKARNYLSDITLKGEEGFNFVEKVYFIVFKKTTRLDHFNGKRLKCD